MLTNADYGRPPEPELNTFNANGRSKTTEKLLIDAGISALSENSGPDEIIEAIGKFLAITGNKDVVWLGIAKSELIKKLGDIGVKSPSKMVNEAMKTGKAETVEGQGQAMSFEDPEPWADEVDGVKFFNEITQTCNRFLVLRECGAETITLWAIHAWAIDAAQISPYLILQSPEKRCGKTTTLNLLSELSPNPIPASSISPAALFRSVEKYSPTLLIDEADRALKNSEELNCILNASHVRKSAVTIRTVGENHEPRKFSTWCPKAIAAIGRLQDTLEDRGIILQMRRKTRGEKTERWRGDRVEQFTPIRQKIFRWVQDNLEELRELDPEVPSEVNDRAADNWRPLLAIADLVGGEWPDRARKAALKVSGGDDQSEETWGEQLLSDIRDYFKEQGADRVSSEDLVKHLHTLEERPWPEMPRTGKGITKAGVARILKRYDIKPNQSRGTGEKERGYDKEIFFDAWTRYLRGTAGQALNNKELKENANGTNAEAVPAEKQPNLFKNNNCPSVPDGNGDMKGKKLIEIPSYENDWGKVTPIEGGLFEK